MKRWLVYLLVAVMVFSLFACSSSKNNSVEAPVAEETEETIENESNNENTEETIDEEAITLNVYMLAGPTGIGAANMIANSENGEYSQDYTFTIATAPDEVVGKIVKGEADIAAIPTNLASTLYAKTNGEITVLGVNTLGVLSLLETEQKLNTIQDIKGRTIYSTGSGSNPQYILEYVLRENGIDPEKDVTIIYKTENTELATVFNEDPDAVIMAPQPVATSIVLNSNAVVSLDMTEEWEKVASDSVLMMGCAVVRNEILESNPKAVEQFMADYAESITAANEDAATTGQYCEDYGIVAKAALATKAIPACNLVWITGDEMRTGLEGYLTVLFNANPDSIGGKLPDESFYF